MKLNLTDGILSWTLVWVSKESLCFFNSLTLLHKCFDVLGNLSSLLRLLEHHIVVRPKADFLLTICSEINFQLEIYIMGLFLLLVTRGNTLFYARVQHVSVPSLGAQGGLAPLGPGASRLLRALGEQSQIPRWSVLFIFITDTRNLFGKNMALL